MKNIGVFFKPPYGNRKFDMKLELEGGELLDIKGRDIRKSLPDYIHNYFRYLNTNRYEKSSISTKMLNDSTIIVPDSTVNYKGRVYVLCDDRSCSAATLFPAMTLRSHRGVIVGRDTASAYHFLNALKFAQIHKYSYGGVLF